MEEEKQDTSLPWRGYEWIMVGEQQVREQKVSRESQGGTPSFISQNAVSLSHIFDPAQYRGLLVSKQEP